MLGVVLVAGTWLLVHSLQPKQNDAAVKPETAVSQPKTVEKKQATESAEHHGNSPDCPDTDCIAMLVNGDLLFHEGLWNQYASTNTAATDGTAFDFTGLFEPMRKYIDASDIAVCEFETPIAQRGGPYTGYPVFNIPAEVADAAKNVGYHACTHASNHSWDQGADGIARLWDTLDQDGIAQTGSYAMMSFAASLSERSRVTSCTCPTAKSSSMPWRRSSKLSPTHSIGCMPAANTART